MADERSRSEPKPDSDVAASRGAISLSQSEEVEVELIRSLLQLTGGRPSEFADYAPPPGKIAKWIRETDLREVKGMLIAGLRRWHKLRQQ